MYLYLFAQILQSREEEQASHDSPGGPCCVSHVDVVVGRAAAMRPPSFLACLLYDLTTSRANRFAHGHFFHFALNSSLPTSMDQQSAAQNRTNEDSDKGPNGQSQTVCPQCTHTHTLVSGAALVGIALVDSSPVAQLSRMSREQVVDFVPGHDEQHHVNHHLWKSVWLVSRKNRRVPRKRRWWFDLTHSGQRRGQSQEKKRERPPGCQWDSESGQKRQSSGDGVQDQGLHRNGSAGAPCLGPVLMVSTVGSH